MSFPLPSSDFMSLLQFLNRLPLTLVPSLTFGVLIIYTLRLPHKNHYYISLVFLYLFSFLLLYTFIQVAKTDPGSPETETPQHIDEDDTETERVGSSKDTIHVTITLKQNGERRKCTKCQREKPDRTHHCSTCRKCVLRMDHHCPWINNCVGFHNHKFFWLFLLYGAIACIIAFATSIPTVVQQTEYDVATLIILPLTGLFGLTLVGFVSYHTWLILRNTTTLESMEGTRYHQSLGIPADLRNPFDRGYEENWKQVFGHDWYWWFLPVSSTPGNGHYFAYKDASGIVHDCIHSP